MYIPKKYGQSKVDKCPFCDKHATTANRQKVPVCQAHKDEYLDGLKCACGSTLDVLHGKFGAFFSCIKCGNMSLKKVMEMNTLNPRTKENKELIANNKIEYKNKTITTVRSDDPRYFD